MVTENHTLKRCLILQSFSPLFLLLLLKYVDLGLYWELTCKFVNKFAEIGAASFLIAVNHPAFGGFAVSIISVSWLILTTLIALGFNGMQESGFLAEGESIVVEEAFTDSGASFLVTYILPLLMDQVEGLQNLIVFVVVILLVIVLLSSSNTFYQNPVLAVLKYKAFSFKFVHPAGDIKYPDRIYIGLTRGKPIEEAAVIKRKYIADNVFVIYNAEL